MPTITIICERLSGAWVILMRQSSTIAKRSSWIPFRLVRIRILAKHYGQEAKTQKLHWSINKRFRLGLDNFDTYYSLGFVLRELGRLSEAISAFANAAKLRPNHALSHYHFGRALAERGQAAEAIAEFQQTISLKPDYAQAWLGWETLSEIWAG